jgi:hypothetical protein
MDSKGVIRLIYQFMSMLATRRLLRLPSALTLEPGTLSRFSLTNRSIIKLRRGVVKILTPALVPVTSPLKLDPHLVTKGSARMDTVNKGLPIMCPLSRMRDAFIVESRDTRRWTVQSCLGIENFGEPIMETVVVILTPVKGVEVAISPLNLIYPIARLKPLPNRGESML